MRTTLAQGEYSDIQSLCKHLGLTAKGARAELERRITEHIKAQRDISDVQESPQGRGGRGRSPKPGKAASTVRAEADKLDKEPKPRADTASMAASSVRHPATRAAAAKAASSVRHPDSRLLNAAEFQATAVNAQESQSTGRAIGVIVGECRVTHAG